MKSLGEHILIEFYGCDNSIINDERLIEDKLVESVELSGATIVKPVFHKFSPHGVSGVIVIAESHFSIHTWPEYGYCALDIFTCGDKIKSKKALNYLRKELKAKNISVIQLNRGMLDLPVEKIRHKPTI
ncbi:MAG: S-adenosylmethionine decarboxylase proenzyme [Candidatus Altiarchaeales archaeon]|nr:S-adenosylmethionine decarboxylase proenzyme [Candidatus Altiarchaeales archaeon]MBD3416807.1 S-adenosylmethionine decarboxylase proenzyme [Candidatus Altiarchaeales archaeon]